MIIIVVIEVEKMHTVSVNRVIIDRDQLVVKIISMGNKFLLLINVTLNIYEEL